MVLMEGKVKAVRLSSGCTLMLSRLRKFAEVLMKEVGACLTGIWVVLAQ